MQLSPGDGCGDFLILVQCVILQCSLFDINLEPTIEVKERIVDMLKFYWLKYL